MPPITWQNVMGPSLADASRPLEAAQRSFNGVFEGLGDVLKQKAALVQENFNQGKVNNTNEALNQIQQYASPEEYAAAQKSGAIAAIIGAHGAQADQAAIRNAADSRLSTLQQRATQGFAYQNAATDQAQAGLKDQIATLINSGDKAQVAKGQAMLAEATLREKAGLSLSANTAARQLVTRSQDDQTFSLNQDKGRQEIQHSKNQDAIGFGNLSVNRAELGLRQKAQAMQMEERLADRSAKLRTELGSTFENSGNSAAGTKAVFDQIDKIDDPGTKENMRQAAKDVLAIPGITTGVALTALASMDGNHWYKLNATSRKEALTQAVALAKNVANTDFAMANEVRKGKIMAELKKVEAQQAGVTAGIDGTKIPARLMTDSGTAQPGEDDRPGKITVRQDPWTPEARATAAALNATSSPVTVVTPTAAFKPDATMEAKVIKENLKMARNEAMDYTPEVKAYVRGKAAAETEGLNKARSVLLKPELERQLREARAQAAAYR